MCVRERFLSLVVCVCVEEYYRFVVEINCCCYYYDLVALVCVSWKGNLSNDSDGLLFDVSNNKYEYTKGKKLAVCEWVWKYCMKHELNKQWKRNWIHVLLWYVCSTQLTNLQCLLSVVRYANFLHKKNINIHLSLSNQLRKGWKI